MRWSPRVLLVPLALAATAANGRAEVLINEVMAKGAERVLRWSAGGVPALGFGTPWYAVSFDDSSWYGGNGPFGFGSFSNVSPAPSIGTNTASQMQNLTPTLYLRKSFTVSGTDAARADVLNLEVQFNDGFVCFLNGVEVARRNAGPVNGFIYHDQYAASGTPANLEPSTTPYARSLTIPLGAANTKLVAGTNVLAVHALNHWDGTTAHNTGTNGTVAVNNRDNFLFKADLKIATTTPVTLVSNSSAWRYLPGVVEPSGGVHDVALRFQAKQNVAWGRPSWDDSAWPGGAAPFGAGTPPSGVTLGSNLSASIPSQACSVYLRTVFTATSTDLADTRGLELLLDWDDGFVAYLNGVEVARSGMAEANSFTPHDAVASAARTPGSWTTYTLDPPARLLQQGQNVLAVQVHNVSLGDSDLFFRGQLRTNSAGGNRTMVAATATWKYFVGSGEPVEPLDETVEDNPEPADSSLDWVELHNNGSTAADLTGWSLSDSASEVRRWIFPAGTSIPAGGYLVVACDGLDITAPVPGGMLHTNFRLDGAGESVVLGNAAGAIVQQVDFGPQSAFQSHGRGAGGSYGFLDPPTPGAANSASQLAGQVAPVQFSLAAGFHTGTKTVTLTTATGGATIRYTFDGTEPTETTGTAGTTVTLTSSRAVRARAFKTGWLPSDPVARTYLINEPSNRKSVPALCITADEQKSLYRPHGVMAISGGSFPTWSSPAPTGQNGVWTQTNGTVGAAADLNAYDMPNLRGQCLERPANLELLRSDGTPGPNIEFGLRISGSGHARPRYKLTNQNRAPGSSPAPNEGAWSSTDFTQKPSFNLFFRGDLGGDPLEWPLFPGDPVSSFHDLRVRAGKNDVSNPFIEDEYMRRVFLATGQTGSRGIINTLYVNGVYKGYYNLCEHLREDFFRRHHGGQNEWDVRQVTTIASGDGLAFQEMLTFLRNNPQETLANYQAMKTRLDMVNFIDYLLVNLLGVTGDWPHNNYVCARERTVDALHRYYLWDAEGAFGDFSGNVRTNMFQTGTTASVVTASPATVAVGEAIRALYTLLRASPEFKLLFADRIQRHFFNNGALTNANLLSLWNGMKAEFAALISPTAVTDKVTPWVSGVGDPTRYTTSGSSNSPSRRNVLLTGYYDDTAGGAYVPAHFVAEGLWPATLAPVFNRHGGTVAPGYNVTLSNPNGSGTVYITTTGVDPRAEGGGIAGQVYAGAVAVHYRTTIKARVRSVSGEWSPLSEATFETGLKEPLLITEIMYHPPDNGLIDGDEYEFIEIKNTGSVPVHLGGMSFQDGLSHVFPAGTMVGAGQFTILARSAARFAEKYPGVAVSGEWGSGYGLANGGETLTLVNTAGQTLFRASYGDAEPWPGSPDGGGNSLVPVNPNANPSPDDPAYWRASSLLGGSPGADDPAPLVPEVLVTEVLAKPSVAGGDKIELHNPNGFAVDIGHWWISDSDESVQKFRVPAGTVMPAGGYAVFTGSDFAGGAVPFAFSSNGEKARVSSGDITGALTGFSHTVEFDACEEEVSMGRHVTSTGQVHFVRMREQTFGGPNSGPLVGPVVISELMYSPASGGDEFVELKNITGGAIPLHDPANPANTWQVEGIGWSFPAGVTLSPGQVAILTKLTPESFRAKYSVADAVAVYGAFPGNLNNGGEEITLKKPGVPYQDGSGATVVPFIEVDSVEYDNVAPWPTSADGGGPSLERRDLSGYGDDVANWQASPASGGTPGIPSVQAYSAWRAFRFTAGQLADPQTSGSDADPDGDGIGNFREWAHGTDPWRNDPEPVTWRVTEVAGSRYLEVLVRRSRSAAGLTVHGDVSANLGSWTLGAAGMVGSAVDHGDGTETVVFRHPGALGSGPRSFLRVRFAGP